jgi:hypothetical protein
LPGIPRVRAKSRPSPVACEFAAAAARLTRTFNAIPAGSGSSDNKSPANNSNDPTNVELKVAWTKDRLQDAPDFQYYKPPARTSSTPSPATTGAAPRPTRRAADASRPLRPHVDGDVLHANAEEPAYAYDYANNLSGPIK